MYTIHKGFANPELCASLVTQARRMERMYYNEHTIADHRVYIQDVRPGRKASAYAISHDYRGRLSTICMERMRVNYPGMQELVNTSSRVRAALSLPKNARMLMNVQEYKDKCEAVPKHFDGELLKFERQGEKLKIIRAIRPDKVAVLTLYNISESAGIRLHFPDGTSEVFKCEAGDLIVFNNADCFHSVDSGKGLVLERMIIGWRSLSHNCSFYQHNGDKIIQGKITARGANATIAKWYEEEWPKIHKEYLKGKEAAF